MSTGPQSVRNAEHRNAELTWAAKIPTNSVIDEQQVPRSYLLACRRLLMAMLKKYTGEVDNGYTAAATKSELQCYVGLGLGLGLLAAAGML